MGNRAAQDRKRVTDRIKMAGFNDLFGSMEKLDGIQEIRLSELHPFKTHPFKVNMDREMEALAESIRQHGRVLVPGTARKREEGGYELVSGHRRREAAKLAGLSTMPVIIKEMTDDEAVLEMVDSNIQRENLLYSEKAFAYKMKSEALKHQGSRKEKKTADEIGGEAGESGRNIQRYIRLTELTGELLSLADQKKLGFIPAVDLSYLKKEEQEVLYKKMQELGAVPDGRQASELKKYSLAGEFSGSVAELILSKEKPVRKKVILKPERINKFFPEGCSSREIEDTIYRLLEKWKQEGGGM